MNDDATKSRSSAAGPERRGGGAAADAAAPGAVEPAPATVTGPLPAPYTDVGEALTCLETAATGTEAVACAEALFTEVQTALHGSPP